MMATPSEEPAVPRATCICDLPAEVLGAVFTYLDLKTRAKVTLVSRLWHSLLTGGRYALTDVAVVNLFEQSVWVDNVRANNRTSTTPNRISCTTLHNRRHLAVALSHIASVNSLKLWYRTAAFVDATLELVCRTRLKYTCVDVYPYGGATPLDALAARAQHVTALTIRPHGSDYFWDGLPLDSLPHGLKLDTLLLDSINLNASITLPTSLTAFEWSNRRSNSLELLYQQMTPLANLEYLVLGHIDFTSNTPNDMRPINGLMQTIHYDNMPQLKYLIFKFCRFPTSGEFYVPPANSSRDNPNLVLSELRVLKFDLCYGKPTHTMSQFVTACSAKALRIVALNSISEDFSLADDFYKFVPQLERIGVSAQFGLLQKSTHFGRHAVVRANRRPNPVDVINLLDADDENAPSDVVPDAPKCLASVLCKVDLSFVEDNAILKSLLGIDAAYPLLVDMKFVQCPAVDDEFIETVAKRCVRLKKLTVIKCANTGCSSLSAFVRNFDGRKSAHLCVQWKQGAGREHPAAVYLDMLERRLTLVHNLKTRFIVKRLAGGADGERIVFWQKVAPSDSASAGKVTYKSMTIQDYGEQDTCSVVGFALPAPSAAGSDSDADSDDTLCDEVKLAEKERVLLLKQELDEIHLDDDGPNDAPGTSGGSEQ